MRACVRRDGARARGAEGCILGSILEPTRARSRRTSKRFRDLVESRETPTGTWRGRVESGRVVEDDPARAEARPATGGRPARVCLRPLAHPAVRDPPRPGTPRHGLHAERQLPELVETMKKAAGAWRESGVDFILGGGLCDVGARRPAHRPRRRLLRPRDAERSLEALVGAGMTPERLPEGWLFKAFDGDVLVDLIFRPAVGPVDDATFARAIGARGRGGAAPRRLRRRRPHHEAAGHDRAGTGTSGPCSTPAAPRADRISARARQGGRVALRGGVPHARRAA